MLAWRIAWQGRRGWYDTSTHYHSAAGGFCGLLSANQRIPKRWPTAWLMMMLTWLMATP